MKGLFEILSRSERVLCYSCQSHFALMKPKANGFVYKATQTISTPYKGKGKLLITGTIRNSKGKLIASLDLWRQPKRLLYKVCRCVKGPLRKKGLMTRRDRMKIVYEKLKVAPPVSSPDEGLEMVGRILDEVEEQWSNIPRHPNPDMGVNDGRMYPPLEENIKPTNGGGKIALTRGHKIAINARGDMTISKRKKGEEAETVEFTKAGRSQ